MWYMPYLRVRRAVSIYALFVLGLTLVALALRWWPGVIHLDAADQAHLSGMSLDVGMLVAGSAALVGGFATAFGLNLAAENDGHLELAWTKPVSREGYALGVFAVDLIAMGACIVLTLVFGAIVADVYIGRQAIGLAGGDSIVTALAFCGFPVCIYAWITALSASLKGNRAIVAGLFWPLMIAVAVLVHVPIPAVHAVAVTLNAFNPIEIYASSRTSPGPSLPSYLSGWAIAAALLAAAVAQWRRLEI